MATTQAKNKSGHYDVTLLIFYQKRGVLLGTRYKLKYVYWVS